MGLDIVVYTDLSYRRNVPEEDEQFEEGTYLYPYTPGCPMDRADGLLQGFYSGSRSFSFRAGSYSGYNSWRNKLSELMLGVPANVVWDSYPNYNNKPFFELIHFSDCEGFIGPKTSAKLAKDFEDHRHLLPKEDEYFVERYNEWAEAFKEAAEGEGVVVFS